MRFHLIWSLFTHTETENCGFVQSSNQICFFLHLLTFICIFLLLLLVLQLLKVYLSFVPSFSVCLFCPTRISENRGGSHAAVFHRKKRFRVLLTADPIWDFDKRRIYCSRWNNIIHKKTEINFRSSQVNQI